MRFSLALFAVAVVHQPKLRVALLVAGDDVSRAEWVAERSLSEYRLTEGTLDVIQRAFAAQHAIHQR